MELDKVKRVAIIAMFSDDVLMRQLVLKGGNALDIVHGISSRGSIDVDFSLPDDFDDAEDCKRRICRALRERFDSAGFVVFDEKVEERPAVVTADRLAWWGGYAVEFKIIPKDRQERLASDIVSMRRQAHVVGPRQRRIFKIDISKHEYCDPKVETELDDYTIYVYSPVMIAIEKVRAICQQMPKYEPVGNKRPRARDFYDVCRILEAREVDLGSPENIELFRAIFEAKRVPLSLIGKIAEHREFHRSDWPAVVDTVSGEVSNFNVYFDQVLDALAPLKSLWEK